MLYMELPSMNNHYHPISLNWIKEVPIQSTKLKGAVTHSVV